MEDETKKLTEEEIREFYTLFEKAYTFNTKRYGRYKELLAVYQGNYHLLENTNKPWLISMDTPYSSVAIDNRVASLLIKDYIGELIPNRLDDVEPLEAVSTIFKEEWNRLNLNKYVSNAIRLSAVLREKYLHFYYDKEKGISLNNKKGSIVVEDLDPAQVFIDPNARSIDKANYVFIATRLSKDNIGLDYPEIDLDEIKEHLDVDLYKRGEIYLDNDYITSQENNYTLLTLYKREKEGIRKIQLLGDIVITNKLTELKNIPIAQMRWRKANQSCYGFSLMDRVIQIQKALNVVETAITNTILVSAYPPIFVKKGSGINVEAFSRTSSAPNVVYETHIDPREAVYYPNGSKLSNDVISYKNDLEAKIDKIIGTSSQFIGNIGTAGNTSGGASLAVERSKIFEINEQDNIEEFVTMVSNILIEFIMQVYANDEITLNKGRDIEQGEYNFEKFNMPKLETLKNLQFKYYIELDTKDKYSKAKQRQELMDLFQFENQYNSPIKTITPLDIIKNSDLENKEEIIQRYRRYLDTQTKDRASNLIQIIEEASKLGIDEELVQAGVEEMLQDGNDDKTPNLDLLLKTIEEQTQAIEEQNQELQNQELINETEALEENNMPYEPEVNPNDFSNEVYYQ